MMMIALLTILAMATTGIATPVPVKFLADYEPSLDDEFVAPNLIVPYLYTDGSSDSEFEKFQADYITDFDEKKEMESEGTEDSSVAAGTEESSEVAGHAGSVGDAGGVGDARSVEEAGSVEDAGGVGDAGSVDDAGSVQDAGGVGDVGSVQDAGGVGDAGSVEDAVSVGDAGGVGDAGSVDDAGSEEDAGSVQDAGGVGDAGSVDDAGSEEDAGSVGGEGGAGEAMRAAASSAFGYARRQAGWRRGVRAYDPHYWNRAHRREGQPLREEQAPSGGVASPASASLHSTVETT